MTAPRLAAALALALAPAALAQEGGPAAGGAGAPQAAPPAEAAEGAAGIACLTTGYDIVLRNEGGAAIPAGTELAWEVPFVRLEGRHRLEGALDPGGRVFLTGALASTYLTRPRPCTVTVGAAAAAAEDPQPAP